MAINFPDAPVLDQVFAAAGKQWSWDGGRWVAFGGTAGEYVFLVNDTTTLPAGFDGFVRAENTTGGAITITLPANPNPSQNIIVKDTVGNATSYPITVSGGGVNIEGQANLVIMYNYGWLDLFFTGTQWVQQ